MKRRLAIGAVCAAWAVVGVGCDGVVDESDLSGGNGVGTGIDTASSGSYLDTEPEPEAITEIPPEIRDYFNRSVEERKQIRRALNSEIAQLNATRRRARTDGERIAIDAEIDSRKQKLDLLPTTYPVPQLDLAHLHEGQIGGIRRVLVLQVEEGSTALVCRSTDRNQKHVVMLKLLNMANLTPNQEVIFETPLRVSGTTTISTPRGGERKLFVLKTFRNVQLDPYKPLYEQEHPDLAESDPKSPKSSPPETPAANADSPANKKSAETDPPPSNKESDENAAASKLKLAKVFIKKGNTTVARKRLQSIIDDYTATKAAEEAKKLLEGLD
ncbi:MAG: hypothetical protein HOL01_05555 [Planctomycetaceae bacterium]|nr:hypothetical protein [Planctomycetaceae bacterium]MBT6486432.1 hypothetical protein [Planctomycetaceae bacterium]MBT6494001.1 hypothetical protein [Planctomycetaceae bacterium]